MAAAAPAPSAGKELLTLLMTPQEVTDIGGIYSFVAPERRTQQAFIFDGQGDLTDQPLPGGLTLTPTAPTMIDDKQTKVFGTASTSSKDFSAEISTGGLKIPVAFPIAVEASAAGKKASSAHSARAQLIFLWVSRSIGYTLTGTAENGKASHVLHTEFYGGYFVADIDLSSTDRSKSIDLSAGLTLGELKAKTESHWGMKGSATLTIKNVRIHGLETGPDLRDSSKAIEMFEKWKEEVKLKSAEGELIAVNVRALSEQNPHYQMTFDPNPKSIEQFYRDILLGSLLQDFTARLHAEVTGGSIDLASADHIRNALSSFSARHLITKDDSFLNIQIARSQWATMRQAYFYTSFLVPGPRPVYQFAARPRDGSLVLKTNTSFDIIVYQDGVQKGFLKPIMHHSDSLTGGIEIKNKRPKEIWMLVEPTEGSLAPTIEPKTVDAEATTSYRLIGVDREGGVSKFLCINRDETDFEFHADVNKAAAINLRHADLKRSLVCSSLASLGGVAAMMNSDHHGAGGGGGGGGGGSAGRALERAMPGGEAHTENKGSSGGAASAPGDALTFAARGGAVPIPGPPLPAVAVAPAPGASGAHG